MIEVIRPNGWRLNKDHLIFTHGLSSQQSPCLALHYRVNVFDVAIAAVALESVSSTHEMPQYDWCYTKAIPMPWLMALT